MKIQLASDLHLEFLEQRFPGYRVVEPTDADLLVLAGDIHRATQAIDAFADWPVPVLYVHGNHEAYHEQYGDLLPRLRARAAGSNVHFLENDELVLGGVRFLGCCLWTDYRLPPFDPQVAMQEAERTLLDHRKIHIGERLLTAEDALHVHEASRHWLEARLEEDFPGPTVVISHHAPHPLSIHARYAGSIVNAAFVSDLTPLLARTDLWLHGHVHDSFDYEIAGARIIANPRGYAANRLSAVTPAELAWENPAFNPRLVIELPTGR